jgi:hypothetical protein
MDENVIRSELTEQVENYINICSDEVKLEKLKNVDVKDFSDFNSEMDVTDSGTYTFMIEQKYLREVVKILNLTSHTNNKYVGVQIFKDKIKFHVFNQTVFSEIFIAPVGINDVEDSVIGKVLFFVDREILNKIASRFKESNLSFTFKADTDVLIVSSGNTRLELNAGGKDVKAVNYHAKLQAPKFVCKINTDFLKDAVKYISYFVMKNEVKKNLSQADMSEGMLYGGSYSAVGIYKSKFFEHIKFTLRYENILYLCRVLPYFNKDNTYLFETDNYYLIRDENIYFGFEKAVYVFPPIGKFLKANTAKEDIIVCRRDLLESLNKLTIVSLGKKSLLKIKVSKSVNGISFDLFVKDSVGKISKDTLISSLDGESEMLNSGKSLEFIIELNIFKEVVSHFTSDTVSIKYVLNKALVVRDWKDNSEILSNFSLFSENQLNKL